MPFCDFYAQFKLTISDNRRPAIRDVDEVIWRPLLLVPWNVTIPQERRNPNLAAELRAASSFLHGEQAQR